MMDSGEWTQWVALITIVEPYEREQMEAEQARKQKF